MGINLNITYAITRTKYIINMNRTELEALVHFAKINGMMEWPIEVVYNEYLTTKEVAEDYEN